MLNPNLRAMNSIIHTPVLILVFFAGSLSSLAQVTDKPFFTVEGEVLRPLKLTEEDLAMSFDEIILKTKGMDSQELTFKGVLLAAILDSAGVTLGRDLRGENLVKYILVSAADGYEVIFSLPEIDPEFTDESVILAYQVNGKPLAPGEGPFRIIASGDKRAARWVREVTRIKIVFTKE